MQELINIKNNEAVTTSLMVAEMFGKRHDAVLRAIENLLKGLHKNGETRYFKKSTHKNEQNGQIYPMYYLNRDGFSLLVMGFTGKKALEWKVKFIEAFNRMEAILNEKQSMAWVETRKYGKITRKAETDVIQQLIGYAKAQGSEHSHMLYITYSKLANKIAGIENRDMATIRQLNNLELIERIILFEIDNGMAAELDYHEIYQNCKRAVEHFNQFTSLNAPLPIKEVI